MTERDKEIIRLRATGLTYREIGQLVGLSQSGVAQVMLRRGVMGTQIGRPRVNAGFRAAVLSTADKISQAEAARQWGVSKQSICNWRREAAA